MASKREALIASAEKALQKGRVDLALKEYQKVLEETPNDVNVLQKVGDLYQRMDRVPEAVAHWWKVAEHYGKDGFYLKAIAVYKKINRVDAARLDVYERLAELYGKQGLGMESKSNYQVLADHHIKSGNLAGAIGVYQRMLQADPAEIPLRGKIADLLLQAKRTPEAVKEYALIAGMFREKGAYAEAVQVYERALKHAPENVDVLRALVPLQLEMGHVDAARAALRKALETTPRSVPLFLLAADAALLANDMAEARTYASKAQAVEPENEDVLALVVKVQLKGRRPDLAFAAAAPLADLAVKRGESKKALALLQPIAKAAPDNEELLRKIVDIGVKAGDEAITVPYRSALAEIWRKQGRVVEAAELPFPTAARRIDYLEHVTTYVTRRRPDVPILIAGSGDRLLTVAARHADIIGLTGARVAGQEDRVDPLAERIAFVRAAAGGGRFGAG
ncbi:tetratricopeptide repeat protein, partial [Acidobacteria bacterium ACD]|nr:tetratricopeptide repeat protein [Acidobacteria bacterium ACD]